MSFELRLEEETAAALRKLPVALRRFVVAELRRLAETPGVLSRPAAFPHPLDGQLFDAKCIVAGVEHFFTAMFKYSADEVAIEVQWLIHRHRP